MKKKDFPHPELYRLHRLIREKMPKFVSRPLQAIMLRATFELILSDLRDGQIKFEFLLDDKGLTERGTGYATQAYLETTQEFGLAHFQGQPWPSELGCSKKRKNTG
jgi:hypothetical protein